jgi:hypothetical protein
VSRIFLILSESGEHLLWFQTIRSRAHLEAARTDRTHHTERRKRVAVKLGLEHVIATRIASGTSIGSGTRTASRTRTGSGTKIGSRTSIGPGTRIGSRDEDWNRGTRACELDKDFAPENGWSVSEHKFRMIASNSALKTFFLPRVWAIYCSTGWISRLVSRLFQRAIWLRALSVDLMGSLPTSLDRAICVVGFF